MDALRRYLALGRGQPKRAAEEKPITAPTAPAPAPIPTKHLPTAAAPKPPSALERAIAIAGSPQQLAEAAGVHTNTIWKTLHGSGRVSHKVALAIERAVEGRVRAEEMMFEGGERAPQPNEQTTKQTNKRGAGACDKIIEEAAE